MTFKFLGSLCTAVAFAFFSTGCISGDNEDTQETVDLPPASVTVAQVEMRKADNQLEVVGTIEAVKKAEISSKITGNIISLGVDLGTRVTQDELLVELSAGEISAQVQRARAQLGQERRNLKREENLLKKNATTLKTVKALRDSTRIAEAALKEAQTMLGYAKITAPFSGIITRKLGNVGDLATPGKPLLYIEDQQVLQVVTDIPEAMILKVHKEDRLPVFIPSVGLNIEGVVTEVSPIADPSSRSTPVKLRLAPDPQLRSGQFARVTLAKEHAETLSVPVSAVVPYGQIKRVFVVTDSRADLRLVRTGTRKGTDMEILSGLSEGESVVVTGNLNLLDGQPVIIR